jgi:hypothetical protein
MKEENLLCADHDECLMQAKTAVSWHVRPPSEAKSVVEEGPVKEGHGPMKEENLCPSLISQSPSLKTHSRRTRGALPE